MKTTNEMLEGDLVDFHNGDGPQLVVSIEDDGRWYGIQIQFYGWRDSYGRSLTYYNRKDVLYEDAQPDGECITTILRGEETLLFKRSVHTY